MHVIRTVVARELLAAGTTRGAWAVHGAFLLLHTGLLAMTLRLHESVAAAAAAGAMTPPVALLPTQARNLALLLVLFAPLVALGSSGPAVRTLHRSAPVRAGAVVTGTWLAASLRLGLLGVVASVPVAFVPVLMEGRGPRLVALAPSLMLIVGAACAVAVLAGTIARRRATAVVLGGTGLLLLWTWGRAADAALADRVERLCEGLVVLADLGWLAALTVSALAVAAAVAEAKRW